MNPRDAALILESKQVTALTDREDERRISRAERKIPDSLRMRVIRQELAKLRDEHVAWVAGVVDQPSLLTGAREVMLRRFGAAALLGHAAIGMPSFPPTDAEVLSLATLADADLEYLSAFAGEAMGKGYRSSLYGGGITAAFYRGWLAMLPDTARIFWRRSIAESCPDCITLEAENPWTKPGSVGHPLWTVPGNAPDTLCGGNCRCFLEAIVGGQRIRLEARPGLEVTAIGNQTVNPTNGVGLAATLLYRERASLLTWYQRMAVADPDKGEKWSHRAAMLAKMIDGSARIARHSIRATALPPEVIDPVDTATAHGLRLAKPADRLTDFLVTVLLADLATSGKVLGQAASPFVVRLSDGRTYRQDEIGQAMIFVRRKDADG